MAPHREESLDEVFIAEEQSSMSTSSPSSAVVDNELLQVDDDNDLAIKTQSMIPKSILRPSRYTVANVNDNNGGDSNGDDDGSSMPAHWPSTPRLIEDLSATTTGSGVNSLLSSLLGNNNNQQRTAVVQFTSPLVSSTNTRPRTYILDIPNLYYSASDIKHFKREYRQLVHVQNVTRRSMELNSLDTVAAAANNKNGSGSGSGGIRLKSGGGRLQPHDNTFWRSKVGRRGGRFTSSSSSSTSSSQPPFVSSSVQEAPTVAVDKQQQRQEPAVVDHDDDSFWDPLNDGTTSISSSSSSSHNNNDDERREHQHHQDQGTESSSSYSSGGSSSSGGGGFFSSVFDVAREAVTILNGPSYSHHSSSYNSSSSNNSPSRTSGSVKRRQQCNTSLHLVDTLYLF